MASLCQMRKLVETMWPLSDSNEKSRTDGDTTSSFPQATREAPLSGRGTPQALQALAGTSTHAEKVGLHETQGEAGPQLHSIVCAKPAQWKPFPQSVRRLWFKFYLSVLFQVLITRGQLYRKHFPKCRSTVTAGKQAHESFTQNTQQKKRWKNEWWFCSFIVMKNSQIRIHVRSWWLVVVWLDVVFFEVDQEPGSPFCGWKGTVNLV